MHGDYNFFLSHFSLLSHSVYLIMPFCIAFPLCHMIAQYMHDLLIEKLKQVWWNDKIFEFFQCHGLRKCNRNCNCVIMLEMVKESVHSENMLTLWQNSENNTLHLLVLYFWIRAKHSCTLSHSLSQRKYTYKICFNSSNVFNVLAHKLRSHTLMDA